MQRPTPDGYLLIKLREPYRHDGVFSMIEGRYLVKWEFRDIEGWDKDDLGVTIRRLSERNSRSVNRNFYPWSAIQELEVEVNSDSYLKLLKRFQEQHDHNWVKHDPPTDIFGRPAYPGTLETCEPNKTGTDEGCGVIRVDGVIQYGTCI